MNKCCSNCKYIRHVSSLVMSWNIVHTYDCSKRDLCFDSATRNIDEYYCDDFYNVENTADIMCELTCCVYCPFRHKEIGVCRKLLFKWLDRQDTNDVEVLYNKLKNERLVK